MHIFLCALMRRGSVVVRLRLSTVTLFGSVLRAIRLIMSKADMVTVWEGSGYSGGWNVKLSEELMVSGPNVYV